MLAARCPTYSSTATATRGWLAWTTTGRGRVCHVGPTASPMSGTPGQGAQNKGARFVFLSLRATAAESHFQSKTPYLFAILLMRMRVHIEDRRLIDHARVCAPHPPQVRGAGRTSGDLEACLPRITHPVRTTHPHPPHAASGIALHIKQYKIKTLCI